MLAGPRVARASLSFDGEKNDGIFNYLTSVSLSFSSGKRLDQAGVEMVLKRGKRLSCDDFELRFLFFSGKGTARECKIAISVPKRLLKSAVARNRIKRLVREVFRCHRAAEAPFHMLVSYKARIDGRLAFARRLLREELAGLFDDTLRRARSVACVG